MDEEPGICLDEDIPEYEIRTSLPWPQQPQQPDILKTWAGEVKNWADDVNAFLHEFVTCQHCGAVVLDQDAHTRWHHTIRTS